MPGRRSKIKDIAAAVKGADKLILATDPDREGEAISWHMLEVLKQKQALGKTAGRAGGVQRHHQVRRPGGHRSIPRQINAGTGGRLSGPPRPGLSGGLHPVAGAVAQAAGRALGRPGADRWRCAWSWSAKQEIEAFKAQEYWSIDADLAAEAGGFRRPPDPAGRQEAGKAVAGQRSRRRRAPWPRSRRRLSRIGSVEAKPVKRNPSPPFITSTLQQEASRKLGFNAKRTMQVAQGLYEGVEIGGETVGLITYMRTDGVTMVPRSASPKPAT